MERQNPESKVGISTTPCTQFCETALDASPMSSGSEAGAERGTNEANGECLYRATVMVIRGGTKFLRK